MPFAPSVACTYSRCGALIPGGRGTSRCPRHTPKAPPAFSQRKTATGRRGSTRAWRKLRLQVLAEERGCRGWCGQPATLVDHIVPLAEGGTDARENLQALCKRCHNIKTAAESARSRARGARARGGV